MKERITAEWCRQKSKELLTAEYLKDLDVLETAIRKAVEDSKGRKTEITLYQIFHMGAIESLRERGFKIGVNQSYEKNEPVEMTKISW